MPGEFVSQNDRGVKYGEPMWIRGVVKLLLRVSPKQVSEPTHNRFGRSVLPDERPASSLPRNHRFEF